MLLILNDSKFMTPIQVG